MYTRQQFEDAFQFMGEVVYYLGRGVSVTEPVGGWTTFDETDYNNTTVNDPMFVPPFSQFEQYIVAAALWKANTRDRLDAVPTIQADVETMQGDMGTMQTAMEALEGITRQSGSFTRSTSDSSGTQDVTTSFQPSIIFFSAVDSANSGVTSDGVDTGSIAWNTRTSQQNVLLDILGTLTGVSITNKDGTNSIYVFSGTTGWRANVSAVAANKFTLNWTKLAGGRNITVKWLAIK